MRRYLSNYLRAQQRRRDERILRTFGVTAGSPLPANAYVVEEGKAVQFVEKDKAMPIGATVVYKYKP